jgi:hypothetical protein
MWIDPIVEEIRESSKNWSDQFGGDLHAMCEDLRRRERESGRVYISLPPRKPTLVPISVAPSASADPSNSTASA